MDSFSYYNIDITYDDFNLVPDGDDVRMYRDKTFMEKYPKLMYIPIILGFILLWYIVGYIIIFFNTN